MSPQIPSRREILKTAAAGAAALSLAPAIGLAKSNKPDATLRWGVIGMGNRGTYTHLPVIKEAPESQVVAICDISEAQLKRAESNISHPVATYTNYQKLLASADLNAVVIATPNLMHREMLLAAIQAGKNVLCEKPCGASPADAAAMKQAADSASTLVMFGMQYRNNPRMQIIAKTIADGEIGKPRYMVQNSSRGDWKLGPNMWQFADPKLGGKPMNWRFSHTATGGTLNEFDCHYFDLLHWFAGSRPQSISADGGISVYHDGRDTWDHASVTLNYPNEVTAVHTLCIFSPGGRTDLQIFGDEGSIEMVGNTFRLARLTRSKKGNTSSKILDLRTLEPPPDHSRDHATLGLYKDFLACVKTGKKPDANADRAVTASRTCWLAEMAAQRKTVVKWNELTA